MIVNIQGTPVTVDRDAGFNLLILLSEYHGRLSKEIGETGDMVKSTELARTLITVQAVYDDVEQIVDPETAAE